MGWLTHFSRRRGQRSCWVAWATILMCLAVAASTVPANNEQSPGIKFISAGSVNPNDALLKAIAFAKDNTLATGGMAVKVWKIGQENPLYELEDIGTVEVAALAFAPDGAYLAIGCKDGAVILWDCKAKKIKHRMTASDKGVLSVSFSTKGDRLVSGDFDGQVNLWDVASGKNVLNVKVESRGVRAAISPDGGSLVSCGETVTLWDAASGKSKGEFKFDEPRAVRVQGAAFSPDNKSIATAEATADLSNAALLWSLDTRKLKGTMKHELGVTSVAFSPNGKLLATTCLDGLVRVWQTSDQKLLTSLSSTSNSTNCITWTPDGTLVAAICDDEQVKVWKEWRDEGVPGKNPKP